MLLVTGNVSGRVTVVTFPGRNLLEAKVAYMFMKRFKQRDPDT